MKEEEPDPGTALFVLLVIGVFMWVLTFLGVEAIRQLLGG